MACCMANTLREVVIMIAGCDRRDGWVGPRSDLRLIASEPWLDTALVQLERNGALHGVHAVVRSKKTLTPPTLSEIEIYRQLT